MTHKTLYVVVFNVRNERTISCGNYSYKSIPGSSFEYLSINNLSSFKKFFFFSLSFFRYLQDLVSYKQNKNLNPVKGYSIIV